MRGMRVIIHSFNKFLWSNNSIPGFLNTGDSVVNKTDRVPALMEITYYDWTQTVIIIKMYIMCTRVTSPIPPPLYNEVHTSLVPPGKHQTEGDISESIGKMTISLGGFKNL